MSEDLYLIVADIEGTSGFVDWTQEEYETGNVRRAMTEDVNAAVEGILSEATDECTVVVTDSHEHKLSIPSEELHPAASLVRGGPRAWGLVSGIEDDPDYALFVGAHAHPGSGGVLEHVFRKTAISDIQLDGRAVGELELNSLPLAQRGTDIMFVSGDDVTCDHVRRVLPGTAVVETKEALGYTAAKCRSPDNVRRDITDVVAAEVRESGDDYRLDLSLDFPVEVSVSYAAAADAQVGALWPGVDRTDSRTIRAECDDPTAVYKFVRAASKL